MAARHISAVSKSPLFNAITARQAHSTGSWYNKAPFSTLTLTDMRKKTKRKNKKNKKKPHRHTYNFNSVNI
jgi:hypothetical protein